MKSLRMARAILLLLVGNISPANRPRRRLLSFLLAAVLLAPVSAVSQTPSLARPTASSRSAGVTGDLSAEEIFRRFASRIMFLECDLSAEEFALASGVLVSADGFVVTNAHVVEGCRTVKATWISGASRQSYKAVLKYYDQRSDTALLKIDGKAFDFFNVHARPARIGERVYSIGNPEGYDQSISEGIVSGKREEDGASWIQHSASISHGSSGGALISAQGITGNQLTPLPTLRGKLEHYYGFPRNGHAALPRGLELP
jgi:S1-C subfamily serine protease